MIDNTYYIYINFINHIYYNYIDCMEYSYCNEH